MKSQRNRAILTGAASLASLALLLSGCSSAPAPAPTKAPTTAAPTASEPITLEFQSGLTEPTTESGDVKNPYETMMDLAAAFHDANPNVTVNVVPQGKDYEGDMKVRMASGDLPDLWSTHGWSLLRYSEFLEPLNTQPWASRVNPVLDTTMKNADGQFFALPTTTDISGIVYNKKVLADLGIDVASLGSIKAFDDALAKIKAAGIVPISSSGKDTWLAGDVADWLGSGSFNQAELDQMAQGTFVDSGFKAMFTKIEEWAKAGFFNPDFASATSDDLAAALAKGDTAFVMIQNGFTVNARQFVPDAELGFMPVPAINGDPEYLIGGEGYAIGAARNGKNKEAALAFLAFLAEKDNAAKLATSWGNPSGLTDVEVNLDPLTPSFDQFFTPGKVRVVPYFDRAWLPNGMWDTLITTTSSIITGQGSVQENVDKAKADFNTLFGQQ